MYLILMVTQRDVGKFLKNIDKHNFLQINFFIEIL